MIQMSYELLQHELSFKGYPKVTFVCGDPCISTPYASSGVSLSSVVNQAAMKAGYKNINEFILYQVGDVTNIDELMSKLKSFQYNGSCLIISDLEKLNKAYRGIFFKNFSKQSLSGIERIIITYPETANDPGIRDLGVEVLSDIFLVELIPTDNEYGSLSRIFSNKKKSKKKVLGFLNALLK